MAQYRGNAFIGQLTIPLSIFSSAHAIFVKLERRSWFFDEAGWLDVSPTPDGQVAELEHRATEAGLLAIH